MSLINFNNITTDSTKNDLYNSYQAIKQAYVFDGIMANKRSSLKTKYLEKELKDNISNDNNDSKNYCLTTSSNMFHRSKINFIPRISDLSNSNSFNIINKSFKDRININKKKIANKSLSKEIKKIKSKILSLKKKKISKIDENLNFFIKTSKKTKTKNYFKDDMEKRKFNPILLYNNLSSKNNSTKDNSLINNSKTKLKELKFKVFHSIKKNYLPLCSHFISNAESTNKKIMEYYSSYNFKKIFKIYKKHFHYKLDIETNPKIGTYTDIPKINEQSSFTKKLDMDKLFTKEEKKLILLEPDYYFKNSNKECFENVNVIHANTLAERINKEEKIKEEELKKNKKRSKTTNDYEVKEKNIKLNNTANKKNIYEDNYINQYDNNKKLVEKIIKKEIIADKEKERKKYNIRANINEEIKSGYFRYRDLINKMGVKKMNLKSIFDNNKNLTDYLGNKNNLISNNYRHIMKHERMVKKLKQLNSENKKIQISVMKDDLNIINNNKQSEFIKKCANKIKKIYKQSD